AARPFALGEIGGGRGLVQSRRTLGDEGTDGTAPRGPLLALPAARRAQPRVVLGLAARGAGPGAGRARAGVQAHGGAGGDRRRSAPGPPDGGDRRRREPLLGARRGSGAERGAALPAPGVVARLLGAAALGDAPRRGSDHLGRDAGSGAALRR